MYTFTKQTKITAECRYMAYSSANEIHGVSVLDNGRLLLRRTPLRYYTAFRFMSEKQGYTSKNMVREIQRTATKLSLSTCSSISRYIKAGCGYMFRPVRISYQVLYSLVESISTGADATDLRKFPLEEQILEANASSSL